LKNKINRPEHSIEETISLRNTVNSAGILSDDDVKQYFLNPYGSNWRTYNNNFKGHLPKKNEYPPTDQEASTSEPPTGNEWRIIHEEPITTTSILTEHRQRHISVPIPPLMVYAVTTRPARGINVITFLSRGQEINTVIIKGNLTEESTMREIMEDDKKCKNEV